MVKSIFSLLSSRQTSILSGALIIMATGILSKVLGLVRDRLLTHNFSSDTVEIFFAALTVPDLIFNLIIFGTLSVAFIPVFIEVLEDEGKESAFKLAQSILNLSLLILIVVTVLVYFFVGPLTNLVVPGWSVEKRMEVENLTRIILIGQIILAVGSFFIGVLQSFQKFIIPALAGVFYNLGMILGIIFLTGPLGILSPAFGVIIGAVFHVLIQLPIIFAQGFRFSLLANIFHPRIHEIYRLMSFRTLGLAAEKINDVVGIMLASLISTSAVAHLTLAQHLQTVPIGLFGATIAQAALPVLSSERARGRTEEFKITLLTTLHQILFLALPATAILIVLRIPVVRLVFGASQFSWPDTVLTAMVVGFLSIGLAAQSVTLLLIRAFYALKDTKTPVLTSFITVMINILLSVYFVLVLRLEVWSLGLAFSISAVVAAVLLFIKLHFKVGKFDLNLAFAPLIKMLMATVIMGVALYIPVKLLDQEIVDTTRTLNLLVLTGIASTFALSIYILLVWFLKVRELDTYVELIKKISKIQNHIKSEEFIQETDPV